MNVPNNFSFRRAISLQWCTQKRCPDSPQTVKGCWALICVLRLSPWDLERTLGFHLLSVFVQQVPKHGLLKSDVYCRICSSGWPVLHWNLRLWFEERSDTFRLFLLIILDTATFDCLLSGCCMSLLHWIGRRKTSNPCSLHKKLATPASAVLSWWWSFQLLIVVLKIWLGFFCTWQSGWLGQHVVLYCRCNLLILWSSFELSDSCLTGVQLFFLSTVLRFVPVVWAPVHWHFVQVYL